MEINYRKADERSALQAKERRFRQAAETAPAGSVAYPMRPQPERPRLFDAVRGLVHYFVRPNDEFALNSLELLDADAYLYRLLRLEGYERTVFIEVEKTDCRIYVYDALSERIFKAAGSGGAELGGLLVQRAPVKKAPAPSAAVGKRSVQWLSHADEFKRAFVAEINSALESRNYRTAVVMPLSIFEKGGFLPEAVIDTVSRLERVGNGGNILLLTLPRRDDLRWCFERGQARLHSWVNAIAAKPECQNIVKEALRELKSRGRIVLADEYQADEIANLLLRKKHLLQSPGLANIPDTVLYDLAGRLKDQSTQGRDHGFVQLPYRDRRENCIRQLNAELDRPEAQRELAEAAAKISPRGVRIAYSRELNPLLLERTYRLHLQRYENAAAIGEILAEFDRFIGEEIQQVKREIIQAAEQICQKRRDSSSEKDPYMIMVFSGPPGTGKTSIAELTARYLHAMRILPTDKTVKVSATQLVSSHIGGTIEAIRELFEQAEGGVLFIDEFHGFDNAHQHGNLAKEAMKAIVGEINKYKDSVCLIVAGYEDEVQRVLEMDQGGHRRFPYQIHFQAYSTDTLMLILETKLRERGKSLESGAELLLRRAILSDKNILREHMGNAGYLENLMDLLERTQSSGGSVYTKEDILRAFPEKRQALAGGENAEEILDEFDRYSGAWMQKIKADIKKTADFFLYEQARLRRLEEAGRSVTDDERPFMNMRFLGPPGTGKTTVAKLVARYFTARGILYKSDIKWVGAAGLVKGTVGATAEAIREAAREANGGVLVIDEFQNLDRAFTGGNVADEAMGAIVDVVNAYQGSLCVIVAGYEEGVSRVFRHDEGAERRFPAAIRFENYDLPTLMEIFDAILRERELTIEPEARALMERVIRREMDLPSFGNAGTIKMVLVRALEEQRLARDGEDMVLRREDVLAAFPGETAGKEGGEA